MALPRSDSPPHPTSHWKPNPFFVVVELLYFWSLVRVRWEVGAKVGVEVGVSFLAVTVGVEDTPKSIYVLHAKPGGRHTHTGKEGTSRRASIIS